MHTEDCMYVDLPVISQGVGVSPPAVVVVILSPDFMYSVAW